MKHLFINDYGVGLKVTNERLNIVKNEKGDKELRESIEIPLKRIKTITILGGGASMSSNMLIKCSLYGIKVYVTDFKHEIAMSFTNTAWHKVVNIRKEQINCIQEGRSGYLANQLIMGKLKNQRSTLLYLNKYHSKNNNIYKNNFDKFLIIADNAITKIQETKTTGLPLPSLLGIEGKVAAEYWNTLKAIFPETFTNRTGRGATDITNISLNFGYSVLKTYIWNCIINAGLEPYAGFLHSDRPGKPSLVLDIMEEYRAWVVDRNIIKIKSQLIDSKDFNLDLRKRIIEEITKTINKPYPYNNHRVSLQSIIQRQVYKLVGSLIKKTNYKSYIFKW